MAVRKEAGEAVLMYGLQWGKHWVGVGYRPSTVVPWPAPHRLPSVHGAHGTVLKMRGGRSWEVSRHR